MESSSYLPYLDSEVLTVLFQSPLEPTMEVGCPTQLVSQRQWRGPLNLRGVNLLLECCWGAQQGETCLHEPTASAVQGYCCLLVSQLNAPGPVVGKWVNSSQELRSGSKILFNAGEPQRNSLKSPRQWLQKVYIFYKAASESYKKLR